jgi:hypothetical protein
MVLSSLGRMRSHGDALVPLGAILFYISDIAVALGKFVDKYFFFFLSFFLLLV